MTVTKQSDRLGEYAARIGYLQRTELDDQGLCILESEVKTALHTAVDLSTPLPLWMVRVRGVSRFWHTRSFQKPESVYFTRDILSGLNGQRISIYFLIRGETRRVSLYIGTMNDSEGIGATVRAVFNSQYHGVELWPERDISETLNQAELKQIQKQRKDMQKELQDVIRPFIDGCEAIGVVTGVPTINPGEGDSTGTQIDRLIRGLYGTKWAFLVLAEPEEDTVLAEMQLAILREQIRLEQEEGLREFRERTGQSVALYYLQLLEMRQEFLETCLNEGSWWIQSYICSPEPATYRRAKALVKSVFSGELSRIDRIRVLDCPNAARKAAGFSPILVKQQSDSSSDLSFGKDKSSKYHTLVSSGHLSALIHLPRVEMPGYYVRESASFDVSSHVPADEENIKVGEILDRGYPTGNPYRVLVQDLTKHCLLVGITGSGKTNSMFYLLQQLQQQEQPISFMVIEPAKREYRGLGKLLPPGRELRVFTFGEESEDAAPFRLNPFQIRPHIGVQTHIDLLKSVFNASFGMWTPLPQVMERAIHEIYRDKGWDPVSNTNDRAAMERSRKMVWHSRAHPTLTDLYHKIGEMVPKLGYDKEVTRNVRTALETRINSLRVGAKGMMLDTQLSIPIEYLLDGPTVLELEGVGDDDEKAFIMGLILMALYEYYRSQGHPDDSKLHVTVIEEAHRLLTNVPARADPEAANLRGKAVETFVNMLSEVRAYGEGFLIAEQIPTKLAPEVVKNTALKIMHRVVSNDDREVMGGAMNLNAQQMRQVVALGIGEAVVHGGGKYGDDNAILVQVPEAKGEDQNTPTSADIRDSWQRFVKQYDLASIYRSYRTCQLHCVPPNQRCADARRMSQDKVLQETISAFVLTLIMGNEKHELPDLLSNLYKQVFAVMRSRLTGWVEDVAETRCILTHALYEYMDRRGMQYRWKYSVVEQMTTKLLPAILAVATGQEIDNERVTGLQYFCQMYKELCKLSFAPFYNCKEVCGDPPLCLFRYNVEPFCQEDKLGEDFTDAGKDIEKLGKVSLRASEHALLLDLEVSIPGRATPVRASSSTALCFAIQCIHNNSALSRYDREICIDDLIANIYKPLGASDVASKEKN